MLLISPLKTVELRKDSNLMLTLINNYYVAATTHFATLSGYTLCGSSFSPATLLAICCKLLLLTRVADACCLFSCPSPQTPGVRMDTRHDSEI